MRIVFVIDSSFTMLAKFLNKMNVLDVVKQGVELFVRSRQVKRPDLCDTFSLIAGGIVRCVEKDSFKFIEAVKTIAVCDGESIQGSLVKALKMLNLAPPVVEQEKKLRGVAREPSSNTASTVIVLSDGYSKPFDDELIEDLFGYENIYRWDQKVHNLALHPTTPRQEPFLLEIASETLGYVESFTSPSSFLSFMEKTACSLQVISPHFKIGLSIFGAPEIMVAAMKVNKVCIWPFPGIESVAEKMKVFPTFQVFATSLDSLRVLPTICHIFPADEYFISEESYQRIVSNLPKQQKHWTLFHDGKPFAFLERASPTALRLVVLPLDYEKLANFCSAVFNLTIPVKRLPRELCDEVSRYAQSLPPYYTWYLKEALKPRIPQVQFVIDDPKYEKLPLPDSTEESALSFWNAIKHQEDETTRNLKSNAIHFGIDAASVPAKDLFRVAKILSAKAQELIDGKATLVVNDNTRFQQRIKDMSDHKKVPQKKTLRNALYDEGEEPEFDPFGNKFKLFKSSTRIQRVDEAEI